MAKYRAVFENIRTPVKFNGGIVWTKQALKNGVRRTTPEAAQKDIDKMKKKGCIWDNAYVSEILWERGM